MLLTKTSEGGRDNALLHRQSRKAARVNQNQRQRCTSVNARRAQADTMPLLHRKTMRHHTASAGDEAYQTSTPKSELDGTTVKKIDTGRLLAETITTQVAEMMTARGNAKMTDTGHTTALATTVGLVVAAGGWAMTMLVARTILPSNTRAAAL